MAGACEDTVKPRAGEPVAPAWSRGMLTDTERNVAVREKIVGGGCFVGETRVRPTKACPMACLRVTGATVSYQRFLACWF